MGTRLDSWRRAGRRASAGLAAREALLATSLLCASASPALGQASGPARASRAGFLADTRTPVSAPLRASQPAPLAWRGRRGWSAGWGGLRVDAAASDAAPLSAVAFLSEVRGAGSPRGNRVASTAIWTGLLGALPGVVIGAAIDRQLLGDEYSEDPGLTGAIAGGALGFGLGGVIGAHLASGGKGDIRIPLAALGAAAGIMAIDVEAGFGATLAAVSIAIALET